METQLLFPPCRSCLQGYLRLLFCLALDRRFFERWWTKFLVQTGSALWRLCCANRLTESNHEQINFRPEFKRQPAFQLESCFLRIFSRLWHPIQPIGDSVDMNVNLQDKLHKKVISKVAFIFYSDSADDIPCSLHTDVCHLRSNARQLLQIFNGVWNVGVVFIQKHLWCLFDVLRLGFVEADRSDQLFQLCNVSFGDDLWRESERYEPLASSKCDF